MVKEVDDLKKYFDKQQRMQAFEERKKVAKKVSLGLVVAGVIGLVGYTYLSMQRQRSK